MPKPPASPAASRKRKTVSGPEENADRSRLQAVLDTVQDAIISINSSGTVKWANEATESVFGWSPSELAGSNIAVLIAGPDAETHNEYIARYLLSGKSNIIGKRRQVPARHRDGRQMMIELAVTENRIDGEPVFVAVARDLTEALNQRAELAVIASEIEAVLDVSPSGIAFFSKEGQLRHVNTVFMDLMDCHQIPRGCSIDAFDRRTEELADQSGVFQPLTQLLPSGSDMVIFETPRHLVLRRSVKTLPGGGLVIFIQDITESYDVDRMKTEFLSSAAHELRTPMASIHGFSELMLKREFDAASRREMLETIHRQSSAMVSLVNELLDLARIEARAGKDFRIRPCELPALMQSVCAEFENQRQISLHAADLLPKVWADKDKLRLVIVNLLSNAVKYSRPGSPVELRMGVDAHGNVEITVEDRGVGMTADQIEHIFDRFYRVDPNGPVAGSGLGMALVKEIINIHQGVISVLPRPGGGLRVRISLRAVADEAAIRMAQNKLIDNYEK
jgi:PAS domain S-box-containing protein